MRNLFVIKTDEMEFLKRMAEYFKDIPIVDINQVKAEIFERENCGCFGAHIAKMSKIYRDGYFFKIRYYHHIDGEQIFRKYINKKTEKLFIKHGATYLEEDKFENIFSSIPWRKHPYKVLEKVINEIEKGG